MKRARPSEHAMNPGLPALAVACALLTGPTAGCATEEELIFGDPARVAGGSTTTAGPGPGPTTTTSGGCMPTAPTWTEEIYGAIFEPESVGACTLATGCHGTPELGGKNRIYLPPNNPSTTFGNLLAYVMQTSDGLRPYVVPGQPEASVFMCNVRVEKGQEAAHPFVGPGKPFAIPCGTSSMPKTNLPDDPVEDGLSVEQINQIAEWIRCGALFN
jgi:hypothetical protein